MSRVSLESVQERIVLGSFTTLNGSSLFGYVTRINNLEDCMEITITLEGKYKKGNKVHILKMYKPNDIGSGYIRDDSNHSSRKYEGNEVYIDTREKRRIILTECGKCIYVCKSNKKCTLYTEDGKQS